MSFNKKEYDKQYAKEHLAQINFVIPKALKEQFYKKLQEENIKPSHFFRKHIENYIKK